MALVERPKGKKRLLRTVADKDSSGLSGNALSSFIICSARKKMKNPPDPKPEKVRRID